MIFKLAVAVNEPPRAAGYDMRRLVVSIFIARN